MGVVDQRMKMYIPGRKNLLSYQSNRYFFNGEKEVEEQGLGFNDNEIITVRFSMDEGLVEWAVGEEVRHRHTTKLFSDRTVVWVPYVFLPDSCDRFVVVQ